MLFRAAHNLKPMNYLLLEFTIYYMQTADDPGYLKLRKGKSQIRGYLVLQEIFLFVS